MKNSSLKIIAITILALMGCSFSDSLAEKVFENPSFSFRHSETILPTTKKSTEGKIKMTLLSTIGASVAVEEFFHINPVPLLDPLIRELTKEEAAYGYDITITPSTVTLSDGTTLKGKKAVSTYKGKEWTRYAYIYPAKDCGLLIYTQIEKSNSEHQSVIDLFWKSLRLDEKLKLSHDKSSDDLPVSKKEMESVVRSMSLENESLRTQLKQEKESKERSRKFLAIRKKRLFCLTLRLLKRRKSNSIKRLLAGRKSTPKPLKNTGSRCQKATSRRGILGF